jgi:hypothetical protein
LIKKIFVKKNNYFYIYNYPLNFPESQGIGKKKEAQSAANGRLEYSPSDPTHASVLSLLLSYPCGRVCYDKRKVAHLLDI